MAFATVLAVSCVKTQILPDGARGRHAITFTAAVGPQGTKALIEGYAFPTDEEFATFAWWLEEGSWDENKDDAQLYIPLGTSAGSRSVVSYDEDLKRWTTATPYYWPSHGSLTFFSFHPHDMNDVTFDMTDGLVIRDRDIAGKNDQQKDIMIAEAAKDRTANSAPSTGGNLTLYTGVPTIFHHTLSRLTGFSIRTDEDYTVVNGPAGTRLSFTLNSIRVGTNAFLKICFLNIMLFGIFAALRVRTKSASMISRSCSLKDLTSEGICPRAMVTAGRVRLCQKPPIPESSTPPTGNQPKLTANTLISISPIQNTGIPCVNAGITLIT